MPENPYQPPKEVGVQATHGRKIFGWTVVVLLVVGSLAVVTLPLVWVWLSLTQLFGR